MEEARTGVAHTDSGDRVHIAEVIEDQHRNPVKLQGAGKCNGGGVRERPGMQIHSRVKNDDGVRPGLLRPYLLQDRGGVLMFRQRNAGDVYRIDHSRTGRLQFVLKRRGVEPATNEEYGSAEEVTVVQGSGCGAIGGRHGDVTTQ